MVGVDVTGTVVQANRRAVERYLCRGMCIGTSLYHCVPTAVQALVQLTLETAGTQYTDEDEGAGTGPVSCFPLRHGEVLVGAIVLFGRLKECSCEQLVSSEETVSAGAGSQEMK